MPDVRTTPAAAAPMGVPPPGVMSRPMCMLEHAAHGAARGPKPELRTTEPGNGQRMSPIPEFTMVPAPEEARYEFVDPATFFEVTTGSGSGGGGGGGGASVTPKASRSDTVSTTSDAARVWVGIGAAPAVGMFDPPRSLAEAGVRFDVKKSMTAQTPSTGKVAARTRDETARSRERPVVARGLGFGRPASRVRRSTAGTEGRRRRATRVVGAASVAVAPTSEPCTRLLVGASFDTGFIAGLAAGATDDGAETGAADDVVEAGAAEPASAAAAAARSRARASRRVSGTAAPGACSTAAAVGAAGEAGSAGATVSRVFEGSVMSASWDGRRVDSRFSSMGRTDPPYDQSRPLTRGGGEFSGAAPFVVDRHRTS
ncbi:hypothetical protein FRIGORI9N_60035 [Frigoribacterium sp. 9N]|nr:hypothetical protein FRIGORI9N_60035 [Frigoribacterium sp. 9N]